MSVADDARRAMPGWPRSSVRAAPWLGVLLAIGGCTVGPKYARPDVKVAEGWHEQSKPELAAQTAVDTQWWKEFNDPVLDELVELAYRQNLPLQIAGLRIVEARAQLGVATGQQYPQVQAAFGSATAVGISENAASAVAGSFDRRFVDYQFGFDAVWELDFWGKYRRGVEASAAGLLSTVADYQSALVSLTAEVARTYVVIRTFEVLIAQAEENARLQRDGLKITQARFRAGATSELDVTQARTLLATTEASIPPLRISVQQARNSLATLLGQRVGSVETLLQGSRDIPRAPQKVGVGLPAEMLRRRPDVRSAEFLAAAQCARVGIAKADFYPSFTLVGTIGLQATGGIAGVSSNPFSADSLFYSAGPRVVWPFLNYGRIKNNVRVEDARFQQQLIQYRDTVLRAFQEVEDALTGFVNSQEAVLLEQRSVASARESVQIAVVQYREGATDYQRVLDTQRSLLQQQNSLAQTSSSVATNMIALFKALGGGWEVREGQPVVPEVVQAEMKRRTSWGDLLSEPSGHEKASPPPSTVPASERH